MPIASIIWTLKCLEYSLSSIFVRGQSKSQKTAFLLFFVSGSFSLMFPISSSLSSIFRILLLQFPHLGSTLSSFISTRELVIVRFYFWGAEWGLWVSSVVGVSLGSFLGIRDFLGMGGFLGFGDLFVLLGGLGDCGGEVIRGLGLLGPGGFLGVLFGCWTLLDLGRLLRFRRFFGEGMLFGIGRFVGGTGRLWRLGYWWAVAGVVFVIG